MIFSLSGLCLLLGWSALVGFTCMLITFPIPTLLYLRYAKLQQNVLKRTDERLGVVSELLNSIRVVKYFGWERAMIARVDEKRDAEQKMIWKRTSIYCISDSRRDVVDFNLVCKQDSPSRQFDCDPLCVYGYSETGVTF